MGLVDGLDAQCIYNSMKINLNSIDTSGVRAMYNITEDLPRLMSCLSNRKPLINYKLRIAFDTVNDQRQHTLNQLKELEYQQQ